MLKAPKIGGPDQLALFVHELGFERACHEVDCHPATMRRWLRGAAPVPRAAMMALYWLTSYGFSDACAEAHWSHQGLVCRVRELERALGISSGRNMAPAGNDADAEKPAEPLRAAG